MISKTRCDKEETAVSWLSRAYLTIKVDLFLASLLTVHVFINPVIVHTYLFINNEFVPGTSGKTFETINPTNGKTIIAVQEANEADVDKAVEAANEVSQVFLQGLHIFERHLHIEHKRRVPSVLPF